MLILIKKIIAFIILISLISGVLFLKNSGALSFNNSHYDFENINALSVLMPLFIFLILTFISVKIVGFFNKKIAILITTILFIPISAFYIEDINFIQILLVNFMNSILIIYMYSNIEQYIKKKSYLCYLAITFVIIVISEMVISSPIAGI